MTGMLGMTGMYETPGMPGKDEIIGRNAWKDSKNWSD